MAVLPKIPQQTLQQKKCERCNYILYTNKFSKTHSIFYRDGYLPICNDCINNILRESNYSWDSIDRLCQYAGIPFIVKEWVRLSDANGNEATWPIYAKIFQDQCYQNIGWGDYNLQYLKLREAGLIEDEVPLVRDKKFKDLRRTWGENYSEEDLLYLEDLYKGLCSTQNVNGALQIDQAHKICKLSLEIDSRIRAGDKDVDKFLASYDKLVKTAEFTPKNMKNAIDFDSFAEVGFWLEKRGRQNKFYDGTTRDIIDETIKSIQNYNQRLYINEGGIGEEITQRLESLKSANQMEKSVYGTDKEFDLEAYDNSVYTFDDEKEDFSIKGEMEDERTD